MFSLPVLNAGPLVIKNDFVEVQCQALDGRFTLSVPGKGRTFVPVGVLAGGGGKGSIVVTRDPVLGPGQCIEVIHDDGSTDRIILYGKMPFAVFRTTLRNKGTDVVVTNKVRTAEFVVNLGKPASELKALGTGGLRPLKDDSETGSYMWMAIADPQTRNGVVGGWITTDRGSGVLFSLSMNDQAVMRAQVEYGKLRIAPGAAAELEAFAFGFFEDARLGMEAWADTVARVYDITLPAQPVGYCTWYHARAWSEGPLAEQAVFAGKNLRPYGFSVIQIDDGWQDGQTKNGPKKNFTRIKPDGPYPSGMKAMADKITAERLVPGIWFMPFSGSPEDPWYKDHQDWFVKRDDGTPHESRWGGACLDMSQAGAREYLKESIRRMSKEWGYKYFKMDGLCSGAGVNHVYVNDAYKDDKFGDATFSNPDKPNIEVFRDGLKLVRETAGNDVYILGCTVAQNMRAYGGGMGLVDAMRIGPDNNASWKAIMTGPKYGTRNYHLNGRIWHNDPDCIYARASVPMNQAQLLVSWATLSGQLGIISEEFMKLPPERVDLLKRMMPSHCATVRPVDLFDKEIASIWLVTDNRCGFRRDVVGFYNWDESESVFDCSLEKLGLPPDAEYTGFDYWGNSAVRSIKERIQQRVPAQSCVVLALRAVSGRPQVISSSRHITQGIVDVVEEKWDAEKKELAGVSKIVGNDPYELRVVLPPGKGTWKILTVNVSEDDKTAGVTIEGTEKAGLLRAMIKSAQSRDVHWRISFKAPR
jgi:hypothetical protein